jgi:hypothetical protein
MAIAALVVALVSAQGSIYAVWYARQQAGAADRSASAAERSAVAAERAAALEAGRRHDELTPRFRVSVERANPGAEGLSLSVFLVGPPQLEWLDGMTLAIRDDHPWRAEGSQIAGGPTREQVAAQIWGPYRFTPGTGPAAGPGKDFQGADSAGRVTPTGGMPVGEALLFQLEPTWPPRWSAWSVEDWRRNQGTVLRLQLEAYREGFESWSLACEIDTAAEATIEVPFTCAGLPGV